jgi:hypothetical protein
MDDGEGILVITVVLLILNFVVGGNIIANFFLGMLSALLALIIRRRIGTTAKT